MEHPVPAIDRRTALDIVRQVEGLLKDNYVKDRASLVPAQGVSRALIQIFGRFAEIIIQRLNRVPEKNLLAFMDLLGVSLLPPQPARVPLTFSLAAGSAFNGVVPARTQVAAEPAEGEKEPTIFETERELVVTAAELASIFVRDPARDEYADYSDLTPEGSDPGRPVFQGNKQIEHSLYLGEGHLLGLRNIVGFTLTITFASPLQDEMELEWEFWNGTDWEGRNPQTDKMTNTLRTIKFAALTPIPISEVNGIQSRWLRGRLLTPITLVPEKRAGRLPVINALSLSLDEDIPPDEVIPEDLPVEAAFMNALPVDLSKDFYPFGEKPKFGDILYLANREAFSEAGTTITLTVTLTNPKNATANTPLPKTNANGNAKLTWEFWDGKKWIPLGTAVSTADTTAPEFTDTTQAFTKTGNVTLTLPKQSVGVEVNGTENLWLRVRLVSGNYGEEAQYVLVSSDPPKYNFTPASFSPPSIQAIKISYVLHTAPKSPDSILTYNDFFYEEVSGVTFTPYEHTKDTHPTLYFGFTLPSATTAFPNRTLSMYLRIADAMFGTKPDNPVPASSPSLSWEMGTERVWTRLTVRDETQAMTRSGLVEFLPPADTAIRTEFGIARYWLRVRWEGGEYRFHPKVKYVLLNTTTAVQTESMSQEILGSSDGGENQRFQTIRKPVLDGQVLDVREVDVSSTEERAVVQREEGAAAVSVLRDTTGRPTDVWVRWHEVPDFYGSVPRSRHYVLNHLTGKVRFGDGVRGLIPPLGTGNIRMTYQTGGGVGGNKLQGTIVQLKTTIPYVDKVTNAEPALGGADAELMDDLLDRAPRTMRHRGRAVTPEDYEDLALLASSEVARAKCVPLRYLVDDPVEEKPVVPGSVSVIIVPRSNQARPQPSMELVARVQDYLERHSVPTTRLVVVGPLYIRVGVSADIVLTALEMAGEVEEAIQKKLAEFLNPLTGGLDGTGWNFGREPHASDLYALLGRVRGVDHVNSLTTQQSPDLDVDLASIRSTGRFLVYSGTHAIRLVFAGA